MDRRWFGALVLLVVVLAAVVVPNVVGRRMAGAAERLPVPATPQVGDCVADVTSYAAEEPGRVPPLPVQTADIVACTGEVSGEVVSVDAGMLPASSPGRRSPRRCGAAIRAYAGDPAANSGSTVFQRIFPVQPVLLGPTARDRVLGAAWTACVVIPFNRRPYSGSLRNALSAGDLPPEYSLCLATMSAVDGTPCSRPHRVEVLGYTDQLEGAQPLSAADTQRACVEFAASVTGRADPTFSGVLAVQGVSNEFSALRGTCVVTVDGANQLSGTIIGIGDAALPWG